MIRAFSSLVAILAFLTCTSAQARVLLLICQSGNLKYEVRFDTIRQTVTTNHPRFKRPLRVEQMKEDEDGLLLWANMTDGPSQANFLAYWGKTRWVRHFQGYDQTFTDTCL